MTPKAIQSLQNNTPTTLDLRANEITDEGVVSLAEALKASTITSLDLRANEITDEGVVSLAEALKASIITSLDLGSLSAASQISDEEIIEEKNPIKKANLIIQKTKICFVPSLVDLGLFAVKNFYDKKIETLKPTLPKDLYEKIVNEPVATPTCRGPAPDNGIRLSFCIVI